MSLWWSCDVDEVQKCLMERRLVRGRVVIVTRMGQGQEGNVGIAPQVVHGAGRNQFIFHGLHCRGGGGQLRQQLAHGADFGEQLQKAGNPAKIGERILRLCHAAAPLCRQCGVVIGGNLATVDLP